MDDTGSSTCGKPCLVYSRVVGYFRPVQHWNDGKRLGEYPQRKTYRVDKSLDHGVNLKSAN